MELIKKIKTIVIQVVTTVAKTVAKFFTKTVANFYKNYVAAFIKSKCIPVIQFLHEGWLGAVITLGVITTIYFSFEIRQYYEFWPLIVRLPVSAVVVTIALLLIHLLYKLIFKRSYLAQTVLILNYCIIVSFTPRGGTGFVIGVILFLLGTDFFGRSIYSWFIKKRRSIAFWFFSILSGIVIISGVFFICCKGFASKNVSKYYDMTEQWPQAPQGFEASISEGPYETESLTYGHKGSDLWSSTVDISGYANRNGFFGKIHKQFFKYDFTEVPLAGKIWLPKDAENCPVIFIIHGNHEYPVKSYLGYDYLGKFLASWGYVLVSVDETCCNDLWGENDARAILLLENINRFRSWSSYKENVLYGKIDMDNIAIAGHSRGGEAIGTAQYFNKSERLVDNGNTLLDYNFNIKALIAISPTVDQYMPANKSVHIEDVNYFLIHGSNDQDVKNVMGEKQYNNVKFTGTKDCFKTSLYVLGANHGQFNTTWGLYDLPAPIQWFFDVKDFISEEDQQKILCSFIKTYLDVTLKNDLTYKSLFSDFESYAAALPHTAYEQTYDDNNFEYLFDFDGNYALGKTENPEISLKVNNADSWYETIRENANYGPSEDYTLGFYWDNKNKKDVCLEIDLNDYDMTDRALTFKLADKYNDSDKNTFVDYSVVLYDINGMRKVAGVDALRKVYPPLAVQLYKVDVLSKNYDFKHQFTTVTAAADAFTRNVEFDLRHVQKIEIKFPSENGNIQIDDIGFVKGR